MAKKNTKDEAPNPNAVANRDILQRLNFLYQASVYMNSIQPPSAHAGPSQSSIKPDAAAPVAATPGEASAPSRPVATKKRRPRRTIRTTDLAREYVKDMKLVGRKTTVRLDPSVKRTICKGCNLVLLPGTTARVRIHASCSHGNAIVYTCLSCHMLRRIPAPPTLDPPTTATTTTTALSEAAPGAAHHEDPPQSIHDVDQAKNDAGVVVAVAPCAAPGSSMSHAERERVGTIRRPRGKKPRAARPPPLFQRANAGHVVFRGNEPITDPDASYPWA
ncbi:Rpr2-domain-containing protein [Punctularia strigosozonata HHB-11173 SS5]|uniref:Rpr2-domain-containing protein n=1 Tax=Punctularia strigosozonata (strain HHB-11173) TaxID=741275 RepID=UPI0004418730|nr:Rpr2-domain-containing protein [Punctularia strigosozonata HHB-11173 SS5]EIN11439.1 Rpr2-domain-containing protein [Punctularia strigosozonata HHB-11173 SS5]